MRSPNTRAICLSTTCAVACLLTGCRGSQQSAPDSILLGGESVASSGSLALRLASPQTVWLEANTDGSSSVTETLSTMRRDLAEAMRSSEQNDATRGQVRIQVSQGGRMVLSILRGTRTYSTDLHVTIEQDMRTSDGRQTLVIFLSWDTFYGAPRDELVNNVESVQRLAKEALDRAIEHLSATTARTRVKYSR